MMLLNKGLYGINNHDFFMFFFLFLVVVCFFYVFPLLFVWCSFWSSSLTTIWEDEWMKFDLIFSKKVASLKEDDLKETLPWPLTFFPVLWLHIENDDEVYSLNFKCKRAMHKNNQNSQWPFNFMQHMFYKELFTENVLVL